MKRTFSCGCSFEVINNKTQIETDPKKLNFQCEKTWELFKKGLTEGVFQLETSLGRSFSKKLKPNEFKHISALTAILRPGCMNAKDEKNVSTTDHYCKRRNNEEAVYPIHDALKEILDETYQLIIFQESILEISKQIAGFSLLEADTLRKGLGKKLADVIASLKNKFIDGCAKQKIVDVATAEKLFENIEASNRYSFNKSHSACYGILTYLTAYIKVHFPLEFFTSWLVMAKGDFKDTIPLIKESQTFDIGILNPDIRYSQKRFSIYDNNIIFGLCDIKGLGEAAYDNLSNNRSFSNFYDLLIWGTLTDSQTVLLIKSGALDYFELPRSRMLFENKLFRNLTGKEIDTLKKNPQKAYNDFEMVLDYVLCNHKLSKNRLEKIQNYIILHKNPPIQLVDRAPNTIGMENETIGISLSVSELSSRTKYKDTYCKELINGQCESGTLTVKIDELREYTIKKGKNAGSPMAFLKVSDDTGTVDCVMWSKAYIQNKENFMRDILTITVHKQKDTFVVDGVV
jgi:DNA polymerase III alpha subunit